MDEQELQRLMAQAMEEIRTLGSVSEDTAKKLDEANKSMGSFKNQIKQAGADLAKDMGKLALKIGEGNNEFTIFNSTVDTVTGALAKMGQSIPFFGAALVAAGEGAKFLLGQLQATAKAFADVGQSGALGAEGMTGLRNQFTEAGVSLQTYVTAVQRSSQTLAAFRGTAADGAKDFSKIMGQLTTGEVGRGLLSLGYTFDGIAEATGDYLDLQTRLGRSQNMTNMQLSRGALEYAKQLDELAKLTGMQKDKIVEQQKAALGDARFRAKYDEMVANGQEEQAKAMLDFQTLVAKYNPRLAQGMAHLATNFVESAEAQEAFRTTGGQATEIMARIGRGELSPEQAMAELRGAAKEQVGTMRSLAMAVGDVGIFSQYAQTMDLINGQTAKFGTALAQQAAQMTGADGLTQSVVVAQQAIKSLEVSINRMANDMLPYAGRAVEAFADVTAKMVKKISEQTNVPVELPQRGYADGGIARGPDTGYQATLHGTEAVIPLGNNQSVPVDINLRDNADTQKVMQSQLGSVADMYRRVASDRGMMDNLARDMQTYVRNLKSDRMQNDVMIKIDPRLVGGNNLDTSTLAPRMDTARIATGFDNAGDIGNTVAAAIKEAVSGIVAPTTQTTPAMGPTGIEEMREMIALMRNQISVSQQILQHTTN